MNATELMDTVLYFPHLIYYEEESDSSIPQDIERATEYLRELDQAPVGFENNIQFQKCIHKYLVNISMNCSLNYVVIPFLIEVLRLKMLPDNTLSYLSLTNITAYYAVYRVVTGDYSSLELEELHYIPYKKLLEVQAISPVREIQWQIARHF